ncbi:MAG: hypothetical protein QXP38_00695 [Nitrososphaerota archaeon]
MTEFVIRRLATYDALKSYQDTMASQITAYAAQKIKGVASFDVREALPVEDFLAGANGITSSLWPAIPGIEDMKTAFPAGPAAIQGWTYALAGNINVQKGFILYGAEIPQSSVVFGIRGGYGKDTTGGVKFAYSFNGLGGADVPRIYLFKQPFLFSQNDQFWIQLDLNVPISTAITDGFTPLFLTAVPSGSLV